MVKLRHSFLGLSPELRTMIYERLFADLDERINNIFPVNPDDMEYYGVESSEEEMRRTRWSPMLPDTAISYTCRQVWKETNGYWRGGIRIGAFIMGQEALSGGKIDSSLANIPSLCTMCNINSFEMQARLFSAAFGHILEPVRHFEIGMYDVGALLKLEVERGLLSSRRQLRARLLPNWDIKDTINAVETLPEHWRCSITTLTFHNTNHEFVFRYGMQYSLDLSYVRDLMWAFPCLKDIRCIEARSLRARFARQNGPDAPRSYRYSIMEGSIYEWYSGKLVKSLEWSYH